MSLRLAACLLALAAGCSQLPPEAAFLALLDARYAQGDTIPEPPEALLARLPLAGQPHDTLHALRFESPESRFSWAEIQAYNADGIPVRVSLSDYAADSAAVRAWFRAAAANGLQPAGPPDPERRIWRWQDPQSGTEGLEAWLGARFLLSCTTRTGNGAALAAWLPPP